MTNENLLNFPQSTVVDKLIPKAKFVKASDTPSSMREQLTKEVEQIRLLYIIREDTINVSVGNEVREIAATKQPHRKRELFEQIKKLKNL